MAERIVDIFTHWLPPAFLNELARASATLGPLSKRLGAIRPMSDLEARLRTMDKLGDYRQVLTLAQPALETVVSGASAAHLCRVTNDGLADICSRHPDRFAGFGAAVSLDDVGAALEEIDRAVLQLGARGIQVYTHVNGKPLDLPEYEPIFARMAELDLPIWLHPERTPEMTDYASEPRSRYEMWWCLGWPYDTSVAMIRLVFSGVFDRHPDLKIITHHLGGMVPYYEGRIGPGLQILGARTPDEDYSQVLPSLKRPHMDYLHLFYADTAMYGGRNGLRCGFDFFGADRVVFASDAPLSSVKQIIDALDVLALNAQDRAKVLHGNAEALLKLEPAVA